ncbi:MAG: DegT/DnrJ/EryC1/StrS family aminotransferase [Deltaproteobacteria bacterium]|nr:DegT/DnrJ/EryC1/StrS family aminotransferase [Deltaproteobacteria bacterium]
MSPRVIPLADPAREHADLAPEIEAAALRVLRSGRYILGEEVDRFEKDFARYAGVSHAIGVSNGTDAIVVALHALGVGPGDEVVTSAFSYFATAGAILRVGATPVFADIDLETFNLDPKDVARKIGPETAAVLAVHLFGRACDTTALAALCEAESIPLVEDAAQGCGAEHRGRRAGALGRIACFSFFPAKPLGAAGDAGACTTEDAELAAAMRRIRAHGASRKNVHTDPGSNYRLDPLQAAILGVKLTRLEERIARRRKNAERLRSLLAPLASRMVFPADDGDGRHVWAQLTLRVATHAREGFVAGLAARGVGAEVYYPMIMPRQPVLGATAGAAASLFTRGAPRGGPWPNAERAASEVVSVPVHPELSDADLDLVARALLEVGSDLPPLADEPLPAPTAARPERSA